MFLSLVPETLDDGKASVRRKIKELRNACDENTLRENSSAIARSLFQLKEFKNSQNLLLYYSLKKEVQTEEIFSRAFELGKNVFVPIVDLDANELKITRLPNSKIECEAGKFGAREPLKKYWDIASPSVIDLAVTPGMAFDAKGGRIGYGKGFYDGLLPRLEPSAVLLALAFDFQVLESVPSGEGDVPVHLIVTENLTINC